MINYSDNKFIGSIDRAKKMFDDDSLDYDNSLLIKFSSQNVSCHCVKHFRDFWEKVEKNFNIIREKEYGNEKDFLINKDSIKFVLESHETGPEIIIVIDLSNVDLGVIIGIVSLIYSCFSNQSTNKKIENGFKELHQDDKKILSLVKSKNDEISSKDENIGDVIKKVINRMLKK
jgi:hypothetical protein